MIQLETLIVDAGKQQIGPVTFQVPEGKHAMMVGPSGAGKTTIVEAIAGLRRVIRGRILLGRVDVTAFHPADRALGLVPQDAVLMPTQTVRENLLFGVRVSSGKWLGWRTPRTQRGWMHWQERVCEMSDQLFLSDLLERSPDELSGGQKQRVALGRALMMRPSVLLLDEPFAALDAAMRSRMESLLDEHRQRHPCTILHISHDHDDRGRFGDLVIELPA
ncbi:MAG: ATP-binding cassette domain-containing protein [Planctomycetota bacterium]